MFGLGHWEIILILVIILIVFGAGKLPKVAGEIAKGIKSFKLFFRKIQRYFNNLKYEISDIETSIENTDHKIRHKKNEVHRPLDRTKKKDTS